MFEVALDDIIALIPDSFFAGKQTSGNIYKIVKVFVEEINKDMETLEDVFNISDINNLTGVNLTLYAAGFALVRGSKTDSELRSEVIAFRSQGVLGTDINSILRLFRLVTGETGLDLTILEKFDPNVADNPRPRAFDIVLPNYSDESDISTLVSIANRVKAAGIDVTINEFVKNNFLLQGNGDFLLQGNGDKLIIEKGPQT